MPHHASLESAAFHRFLRSNLVTLWINNGVAGKVNAGRVRKRLSQESSPDAGVVAPHATSIPAVSRPVVVTDVVPKSKGATLVPYVQHSATGSACF